MRLSRGENRRQLLRGARARASKEGDAATADYLLGRLDEKRFRETASGLKDRSVACNMLFIGWWKARIAGNAPLERDYRDLMAGEDPVRCEGPLALVKLKAGPSK